MRRLNLGISLIVILLAACAPIATTTPVDGDNLDAFVNEGEGVLTTVGGRKVSILLNQDQGLDTSEVVVTLVNLGTSYLVETADQGSRFLPTVQVEHRLEQPLQEIPIPQIVVEAEWAIRPAGEVNLRLLQSGFLGTTTADSLSSFLSRYVLGNGVNLLMPVSDPPANFQEINVYRTPGTLTFLIAGQNSGGGGSSTLLSTVQSESTRLVSISLTLDSLESLQSSSLIQKAQNLSEGILVANMDLLLPINTPEPMAAPQCGENEVLVFHQEGGEMNAVCEPAPWLNYTPVPSPTQAPANTPLPSPTPIPIYNDTFPEVSSAILGNCSPEVHDWYTAIGPDGNVYRTWHPITVKIDPADPDSAECTFAHEHGDPPLDQAPLPYFGLAAYHAGELAVIQQHAGYKVFTHKKGQQTGWDTEELTAVNPDLNMQFWVHQGSADASRLSARYHDVGFWSIDAGDRVTEVYYLADTGTLSDKCSGQTSGGPTRRVADECDYTNELWDFGGRIANAWTTPVEVAVVNPMNFIRGNPSFVTSLELISTSDEVCGVNFLPCDFKLPFGSPNSIWAGNMRIVHNANWQWSNSGGSPTICTDPLGIKVADGLCNSATEGYILQRVAPVNFYGGNSGSWDRTFEAIGDSLRLPLGAGGGN